MKYFTDLAVFPLKYPPDEAAIRKDLVERGRTFVSLQGHTTPAVIINTHDLEPEPLQTDEGNDRQEFEHPHCPDRGTADSTLRTHTTRMISCVCQQLTSGVLRSPCR